MSSTSKQPPLQERPANLHQRVTSSPDDEEFDPLVETLGDCKRLYAKLEECMGEHDRDWTKCQKEVAALKACYARTQTN